MGFYRGTNKGLHVLLSRTQAGPGRTVKQEQEEISRNHVQTFICLSVHTADGHPAALRLSEHLREGVEGATALPSFPSTFLSMNMASMTRVRLPRQVQQRGVNKGLYVLLSRTQAGPGRTVKQEQEEISRNHVQTFIYLSVEAVDLAP